ncbi:MAG TPA: glycosyltransferase, partial [Myxococcota bacterium]|nr:glycosyltransferase [Myxococcota bacterium]
LGLTDRIFVAGRRGDVPRLLAAADVFVLPSWIEGLSLAVVEALAAGVPAVLSRTGDAGFLLGEGAVGSEGVLPGALVARSAIHPVTITPEKFHELVWTCGPAQGAPLAAAITAVLEDLPVRREAARRRAAELAPLLAADRMLRDYATLFRDVVRDRAPLGLELLDRSIAAARSRYQAAHGGAAMLRVASRALFGAEAALVRERSRADANAAAVAELSGVVERTSSALAPVGEKLERALGKLGLGSRLRALFRPATGRSEDRSR